MVKNAKSLPSEEEIDSAIAELVYLKDGINDKLGKLLNRSIKLLKAYRQDRAYYKKMKAAHTSLIKVIRETVADTD